MKNNKETQSYINCKDHLVSGETFQLVHTDIDGLLKTTPTPSKETIANYYNSEAYISHTDSKKGIINNLYQWVKHYSIKRKHSIIKKHHPKAKSLLDIGSGTGDFVSYLKKYYTCYGTEPNKSARELSIKKGNEIHENIESFSSKKFDVITLWHVFEHLHDLEEELDKIKTLLNDDGLLIIAVPNYNSYDAKYYKEAWAAYDTPRHLWHFTKNAMKELLKRKNVIIIKILPLIFDSFYVSHLSEKIKTGKQNFVNAFWIGLKSNFKAKTTKEYSSLIYICKKST